MNKRVVAGAALCSIFAGICSVVAALSDRIAQATGIHRGVVLGVDGVLEIGVVLTLASLIVKMREPKKIESRQEFGLKPRR